jgi:hypothetical protein
MQSHTIPRSLRLVADTNVFLSEMLRQRGRDLIADSHLSLFITGRVWNELEYELPRRISAYVRHRPEQIGTEEELLQLAREFAAHYVTTVEESVYIFSGAG